MRAAFGRTAANERTLVGRHLARHRAFKLLGGAVAPESWAAKSLGDRHRIIDDRRGALLATAMGLFAAILAVIIYNFFARCVGGYRALVEMCPPT